MLNKTEEEKDLGGGFVCKAVRVRLMVVFMLFVRHNRGIKRLILASCCWVNGVVTVAVLGSGFNEGCAAVGDDEED